ncbi:GlxA family transcriptional regulator [Roseovarius sp. D0-M9]|uniref:GlxA family transcriptional regulator n=1 Tax=Roseovarius sp. D0-M9 TaxID=3127117 RepID=UPI00301039DD
MVTPLPPPSCELSGLACLLEPLRVARDSHQVDLKWSFFTYDDQPVTSSSGMRIAPNTLLSERGHCDLALVVGGDFFREDADNDKVRRGIRALRDYDVVIGADTGAWLMARCGLLDGRSATLHWQLIEEFAETFPAVKVSRDGFVRDGRYWTCGSAATALDLILHFIDTSFGPAIAFDVSAMFLHEQSRGKDTDTALPSLTGRGSARLGKILTLMTETIEAPLSLKELAERTNISKRTISRLFMEKLGVPPSRYYTMLRLTRARDLAAHTEMSRQDIALRCGFATTSGLRKALQKQFSHDVNLSTHLE